MRGLRVECKHPGSAVADRLISLLFFGIAYACGVAAVLMLLAGFIDWLQTGRWHDLSVLELAYNAHVVKARWFLEYRWSWWIHDMLQWIPLYALLLVVAPLAWVCGAWAARR